jgi:hypothetical protein
LSPRVSFQETDLRASSKKLLLGAAEVMVRLVVSIELRRKHARVSRLHGIGFSVRHFPRQLADVPSAIPTRPSHEMISAVERGIYRVALQPSLHPRGIFQRFGAETGDQTMATFGSLRLDENER